MTEDAGARIYVADFPSGTPIQVTTQPEGESVWHRQPNWSPDHTRIAYAAGSGTTLRAVDPGPSRWQPDRDRSSDHRTGPSLLVSRRDADRLRGRRRPLGEGRGTGNRTGPGDRQRESRSRNGRSGARTGTPSTTTAASRQSHRALGTSTRSALSRPPPSKPRSRAERSTTGSPPSRRTGKPSASCAGPLNNTATIQLVSVNGGLVTPFSTLDRRQHQLRLVPGWIGDPLHAGRLRRRAISPCAIPAETSRACPAAGRRRNTSTAMPTGRRTSRRDATRSWSRSGSTPSPRSPSPAPIPISGSEQTHRPRRRSNRTRSKS